MIERALLETAVARIIAIAKPKKIILFGSQARNEAAGESDLDLMVLVGDDIASTQNIKAEVYLSISKIFRMPCDILVEREKDFIARGALPTIERRISREGIVLYAA